MWVRFYLILIGLFLFIIFMIPIVNGDLGDAKPNSKPEGTTNINSLVNPIKLNNYFIGNNSYWSVCDEHEDNIRDKKSGYELGKYKRSPIIKISSGVDYKHDIKEKSEGIYEMEVEMICKFRVLVQLNAFGYHEEKLRYPGGKVLFHMDIVEEDGFYNLLGMEAYEHIY